MFCRALARVLLRQNALWDLIGVYFITPTFSFSFYFRIIFSSLALNSFFLSNALYFLCILLLFPVLSISLFIDLQPRGSSLFSLSCSVFLETCSKAESYLNTLRSSYTKSTTSNATVVEPSILLTDKNSQLHSTWHAVILLCTHPAHLYYLYYERQLQSGLRPSTNFYFPVSKRSKCNL